MISGQSLLVTPSLTCSFAANNHLNHPRPALIWPCSSVGRATVHGLFRRSWVRTLPGSEIVSLSPCGPISILGLMLGMYYLGYLLEHFKLSPLNLYTSIYNSNSVYTQPARNVSYTPNLTGEKHTASTLLVKPIFSRTSQRRKKQFVFKTGLPCSHFISF